MKGLPLLPLLLLALAGCRPSYSPDDYATRAVQQMNRVEQGVIIGSRAVTVTAEGSTGAATGGAAGGILGAQAPGGNITSAIGAVGGALVGGLIGTTTERVAGDTTAIEYIVRKENGDLVSVTQRDATPLAIGQRVLVIAGNQARIVADYTQPVTPSAPARGEAMPASTTSPVRPQGEPAPAAPIATPAEPLPNEAAPAATPAPGPAAPATGIPPAPSESTITL